MLVSLIVWLATTASCASVSAAQQAHLALGPGVSPTATDAFPTPTSGLKIQMAPGEEMMSLDRLLDEFSRVTGQNLLISNDTGTMLRNVSTGLNRSVEVPASEVYPFVENILAHNQYILEVLSDHEPRLLAVHGLPAPGRNITRLPAPLAHFVPAKDIGLYAGHPAVLVTTMIELPSTDVRTLSNSLRGLMSDASTQQIVPVGSTNSLILSGSGTSVANLVTVFREGDEGARKADEARRKEKEQQRKERDENRPKSDEKGEGGEDEPK